MAKEKTKNTKKTAQELTVEYRPMRVTIGVATLAALTIVTFAIILVVQR